MVGVAASWTGLSTSGKLRATGVDGSLTLGRQRGARLGDVESLVNPMPGMDNEAGLSLTTIVVLIRAWREGDGIRGRVIFEAEQGEMKTAVATSAEGLGMIARLVLERWVDANGGGAPSRPPQGPQQP